MKKVLFVAAHRPDRSPSQRFRFEQYFSFLEANGFQCELSYLLDEKDDHAFYAPGKVWKKAGLAWKAYRKRKSDTLNARLYDIIFIQREAFMMRGIRLEKAFSKHENCLIFDFDDAIWKLDVSKGNKAFSWLKNPAKTGKIIALADKVIAGNAYLADYAHQFNPNVTIIPTTVDTDVFVPRSHTKASGEPLVIGWSGSKTTVKHFQSIVPVLQKLKEQYGNKIAFHLIGDASYAESSLGLRGQAWHSHTEVSDLQKIDIGIMPLPNDEWSRGKCGLKGLTYMSLEIPTVMSAVGVNSEIIEHGVNGMLAQNDEEWLQCLSQLIEDAPLRSELGKAGRQTVIDRYSVRSQQNAYLNLFRDCTGS